MKRQTGTFTALGNDHQIYTIYEYTYYGLTTIEFTPMCGRYTYFPREFSDLRLTWNVDEVFGLNLEPRYNIAPSQEASVIVHENGKRTLELFQWGLISSWAKDPAIGNKMINARGETIAEKPSFK